MTPLNAPFQYFGGKRNVADVIWKAFGDVPGYIEPFFGSGAVLLRRPRPFDGVETVNDKCGYIANFWRALQADPKEVAWHADRPVNENDLHAIHAWLVGQNESLQAKLEGDPEWFDAKIAGRWVYGICCWIGSGWCSGDGPWRAVEDENGVRQLVNLSDAGRGINRQLVHLSDAGIGVNRKRVNLSNAGRGINRQRVNLSSAGRGINRQRVGDEAPKNGILDWILALAARLKRVRVCCGDWTRVCGGRSGDALGHFFASGNRCAIFLDPPYSAEANRNNTLYRCEDLSVAHAVREWAIRHGNDKRLRIALCGYEGEHDMPGDWTKHAWKASGGYASLAVGESQSKANSHREVIFFSPYCERLEDEYELFA